MERQEKLEGQMFESHKGIIHRCEGEASNDEHATSSVTSIPAALPAARNTTSKYDFVKVRVWLGDNADHYYVMSRFLLCRMLTVTKIPNHVAVKIALELKKLLVDNSLLDVSQSDLEANLFKLMERRGYGEEYINRYRMMTRFHHQRVPFVILVCGTACVGKSTIATQLAQRLNLPNVLQTDMVYELLRTSTEIRYTRVSLAEPEVQGIWIASINPVKLALRYFVNAPLASTPIWAREFSSSEELVTEFCRECRIVRKGLAGDLKKAMKDGKPIIIEGVHVDPSIYLMDEENRESNGSNVMAESIASSEASLNHNANSKESLSREVSVVPGIEVATVMDAEACKSEIIAYDEITLNERTTGLKESEESSKMPGKTSRRQHGAKAENVTKSEKSATKPIIVPIVLKMADFDHKALLEEWVFTRSNGGQFLRRDQESLTNNLKTIQDYLCSFESQGMTVVNISATTFPQTLDWLHNYLLQCIERGCSTNTEAGS